MPVTINGKNFYSKAELNDLIAYANRTCKTNWTRTAVTYVNNYTDGWKYGSFFKNSHTKAVHGILPIQSITREKLLSNRKIAYLPAASFTPHSSMLITYCNEWVFGSPTAANTYAAFACHNLNTTLQSGSGDDADKVFFYIEGCVVEKCIQDASNGTPSNLIENWFYLASDAKVVTEEPHPTYLPQGAFYDQDSVDLYCGRAWLMKEYSTANGELSGYRTNGSTPSRIRYFKNLWSGETIFQYYLYPEDTTVNVNYPLPKPAIFAPVKTIYIKPRYIDGHLNMTNVNYIRNCNFRVYGNGNDTNHGIPIPAGCTWITGQNFWIGSPVSPPGTRTETTGLWHPLSANPLPSVNNNAYNNFSGPGHTQKVCIYNSHINHTLWNDASDNSAIPYEEKWDYPAAEDSYVVGSRSGMLFNYVDISPTSAAFNEAQTSYITGIKVCQRYGANSWHPTTYDTSTAQNAPSVYYAGLVYEARPKCTYSTGDNKTDYITVDADTGDRTYTGFGSWWNPNLQMKSTIAEGETHDNLFGTPGGLNMVVADNAVGNRIIFAGSFLTNQP